MVKKFRWVLIVGGLAILLLFTGLVRAAFNCCAQPPLVITQPGLVTATAPYEPTLYAERQATLRNYATAAGPATYVLFYAKETRLASAYQGTPTAIPPTLSSGQGAYESCIWAWSQRDQPYVTELARVALRLYAVENAVVRVEAYGENCLDSKHEVQYFAAMTTDFYVTIQVEALTDDEVLAVQVANSYYAFNEGLKVEWLPAPLGYLDITFSSGGENRRVRARFEEIRGLWEQGVKGKALIEAIEN